MALREYLRAVLGVERVGAWVVAGLTVALVATVATAGVPTISEPPAADFETTYDDTAQQYTIAHAGGGAVPAGDALTVTLSDGQHTTNVTWADEGGVTTFPVEEGEIITIDDPQVDSDGDGDYFDGDATVGFELRGDETITIRWTGRPFGAPDTRTVVLSEE